MTNQVLRNLVASAILGPVTVVVVISYATLVYAGLPTEYVVRGIGFTLLGAFFFNLVFAFGSSLPGVVTYPQDNPAAILGLVTAGILSAIPASAPVEGAFATVVAAILISSLLTGIFFLLLGVFRLGNLVRYLPYPVVGGFLAGTGSLMIRGAIRSMTGITIAPDTMATLLTADVFVRWLPGLALGLVLLVLLRRYSHFLLLPGILVAAIGLFYGIVWVTGGNLNALRSAGWLLGPFPDDAMWQPLTPALLRQIDWSALGSQSSTIVAIPLICAIALLLNSSGLEIVRQRDINVNHELRLAGITNLVGAIGGSHVSYPTMSLSTLAHKLQVGQRATPALIALVCGATLFGGASLIAYMPNWVLGGLVFYLGFNFLLNWLYDAWFVMSRTDYAVILSILVTINTLGVLAGVGLGIGLAVVLFVVEYSRIKVVKHSLSGTSYRSNVDRPQQHRHRLRQQGDQFHIFELQGFIFFGRSNQLLEQIRQRIDAPHLTSLRFAILDFRQVTGIDASAALSFEKMVQLASAREIILLFTHLSNKDEPHLRRTVLTPEHRKTWRVFPDLDHAVEWCEEQILGDYSGEWEVAQYAVMQLAELLSSQQGESALLPTPSPDNQSGGDGNTHLRDALHILALMERRALEPGQYVIVQGERPRGIHFIESGQLTAQLDLPDGRVIRLRTMQPGVFVGELSIYSDTVASASVVADVPSVVYCLSTEALAQLTESEPRLAAAFHQMIAQLVSERLLSATDTLSGLMR